MCSFPALHFCLALCVGFGFDFLCHSAVFSWIHSKTMRACEKLILLCCLALPPLSLSLSLSLSLPPPPPPLCAALLCSLQGPDGGSCSACSIGTYKDVIGSAACTLWSVFLSLSLLS